MELTVGLRGEVVAAVGPDDTAERVGSGDVPVLATPRLVALAEAATVRAVAGRLGEGRTTVGTRVELAHRAAGPIGARVTVAAELTAVDGRRLSFTFSATDAGGTVLGDGLVERVVVDRERFLGSLSR
ncbi:hypothetical protein Acsp04_26200 [Actinomadura sp. NBRC 104425]|uniref:thioesterase family protein n=1 Tax=Actinomadura sp. NBRC 104425 TaxID=3032204 RepID=UPI0024A1378D|nr:thioesterase [Actinomadura sp. NBRC 104425]GLZ12385.1 hypothetical protein Acsp04_26200 [Actinomadura sp. NBRC 104425]